jgi:hypothetical protein
MNSRPELINDYLASEARRREPSDLAELRHSHVESIHSHGSLLKEVQCAEREIEGIENHIATCDDFSTTPSEYAAMRSEQERHRQYILQCRVQMQSIGRSD